MENNNMSRIEEALKKYNLDITDEEVKEAVKKIIAEKVHENDTTEVKKFLMGSVELTTLKTTDSETSVMAFTEKVNKFDEAYPDLPHVATICVYPKFAKVVSETLEVDGVEIACVSGSFPSSQSLIEVKTVETSLAIKDGATEIDIVMPVGSMLEGDYDTVVDEIRHEGHSGDRLPENGKKHQDCIDSIDVRQCRLYQDINRQTGAGSYSRGCLCHVSGHQGVLRPDGHHDWFQTRRRTEYGDGRTDLLHYRQGSTGREMAHQQVSAPGYQPSGQPAAVRSRWKGN